MTASESKFNNAIRLDLAINLKILFQEALVEFE